MHRNVLILWGSVLSAAGSLVATGYLRDNTDMWDKREISVTERIMCVPVGRKPSSGQVPWVGWCSSPSLVCIKPSKRPGGGGCIPMGLELGENDLCLEPGGLPTLSGTTRYPKGATWHRQHVGPCCSRMSDSIMPLGRSLHATMVVTPCQQRQSPHAMPHVTRGVCRAPCCSRVAHCPEKATQGGPSSPGQHWV